MQKSMKKSVFKPCYIVTAIVLVILIAVNTACGIFADWITYYLCNTATLDSATREAGETLATQIVEEGIVMVKNDNEVLPLSITDKRVNVFGWASTEWTGGGSGSGRVVVEKNTYTPSKGLLEALDERDIEYNIALTDMYEDFQSVREYWAKVKNSQVGTLAWNSEQFYRLYEPSINNTKYYTEELKTNVKNFAETAIVVLGRVAGESNDCPTVQYKRTTKGGKIVTDDTRTYLDISTEEEELLEFVGKEFDNVIVVINSTNAMNLSFMDSIEGLDACLIVGGTGNNAANGVVNILYGCDEDGNDVTPSGRTADTYAYDFKTSPAYYSQGDVGTMYYSGTKGMYPSNLGDVNGDSHYKKGVSYVDYVEGIYVGYKWYETADVEGYWSDVDNQYGKGYEGVVQYPFGYGLSYTKFDWKVVDVTPNDGKLDPDGKISVTVKVTNTGSVAGKETVQLYYTAPYTENGIEKSAIVLAAFAKTPVDVERGESQELTLTFDVRDMASYDSQEIKVKGGGYILEAGDYQIKLMKNAHEMAEVSEGKNTYTYNLAKDHLYKTDKETGNDVSNLFTGSNAWDGFSIDGSDTNGNITYLSRANFKGTFKSKVSTARAMTEEMKNHHLYKSSDANAWLEKQDTVETPTTGAKNGLKVYDGRNITDLGLKLGNPENYDSQDWDSLLDQLTLTEMVQLTLHGYIHEEPVASVGKDFKTESVDGPAQAGSFNQNKIGVGYPNATVLAQSWNVELAKSFGLAIAADARNLEYSGLYAPGMNIHRTPFGGRNYEYYSEDSCLTGAMAAGTVNGCLDGGVYVYVKHFAIYEQETCRDSLYTWMTEQTLREIYLSPFKTCIVDAGLSGMMSAYGRVGATWAGGNEALLTSVLRDEWGFKGAVITDYADHHEYMNGDQMIRAGGDLWMDGYMGDGAYSEETTSPAMVSKLRLATKHILYMILNADYRLSTYKEEGITISKGADVFAWWIPVLIAVDVMAIGACGAWIFLTLKKEKSVASTAPAEEVSNE